MVKQYCSPSIWRRYLVMWQIEGNTDQPLSYWQREYSYAICEQLDFEWHTRVRNSSRQCRRLRLLRMWMNSRTMKTLMHQLKLELINKHSTYRMTNSCNSDSIRNRRSETRLNVSDCARVVPYAAVVIENRLSNIEKSNWKYRHVHRCQNVIVVIRWIAMKRTTRNPIDSLFNNHNYSIINTFNSHQVIMQTTLSFCQHCIWGCGNITNIQFPVM